MVIVMDERASEDQIQKVIDNLKTFGFEAHRSDGKEKTVIGAVGGRKDEIDSRNFMLLPGVKAVHSISEPYKLASRSFKSENTVFKVKDVEIGGKEIILMAGPCTIENPDQFYKTAKCVKEAGAKILRGGAFKPRTSPYAFQGLGEEGLKIMKEVADQFNLVTVSEVMEISQLDIFEKYVDILQIGARNMQNFNLLRVLGQQDKPILLKRGMAATIEDLMLAAEYIMAGKNHKIILCERGIRTFEKFTRNTLDISAIPILKQISHLPVFADPSHGTGIRDKVIPMSRAAIAAGADGLIVEVHYNPDVAICDGPQSLFPAEFQDLMGQLKLIAPILNRTL